MYHRFLRQPVETRLQHDQMRVVPRRHGTAQQSMVGLVRNNGPDRMQRERWFTSGNSHHQYFDQPAIAAVAVALFDIARPVVASHHHHRPNQHTPAAHDEQQPDRQTQLSWHVLSNATLVDDNAESFTSPCFLRAQRNASYSPVRAAHSADAVKPKPRPSQECLAA